MEKAGGAVGGRGAVGLRDCGAVGLRGCRAAGLQAGGQGSTFSPEAGGPAAGGKLAHGKQSPDQAWHPKTNESRDTPSGTGWICASKEELPVRSLIRTFRSAVPSPAVAADKPLPRMTACAQTAPRCLPTLMNAVICHCPTVVAMKRSLERGLREAVENQGVGLVKRFPRWSGIVPSTFCFVLRGPPGTSVLQITTWVLWKGPPQRQVGTGSVHLVNVFRLKRGLLGLIRAD